MKRASTFATSGMRAVPLLRSLTLLGGFLVGCLNPRPEELPSDTDSDPQLTSPPAASPNTSGSGNGIGGTAGSSPDLAPELPLDGPDEAQTPGGENTGAAPDAGVPGDAGADAEAPDAIDGAGASSTSQ